MLNKKELAEKAGLNSHTVSLWDKGETLPSGDNLEALSQILSFPKDFFYGTDIDEPEQETTSFRSQTVMSAAVRDAALAAGAVAFLVADWVDARFDLPKPNLPDLHLYDPDGAARTLRQEWALGEKPVTNMIHLLESKGVRVFSLSESTSTVNAYSLWRKGTPFVFLNTFKSAESSRFDAAHELAHLVLHTDGKVKGRPAEDQANRFASAFLMPEADVFAVLPRVSRMEDLINAKRRWKVSLAALNYRVHKLRLVTDWKYRGYCIEIAKRGYNKQEPDETEREQSVIWSKVIKALWSENATHLDIANGLALPPDEVADLLFGVLNPTRNEVPANLSLSVMEDPAA